MATDSTEIVVLAGTVAPSAFEAPGASPLGRQKPPDFRRFFVSGAVPIRRLLGRENPATLLDMTVSLC